MSSYFMIRCRRIPAARSQEQDLLTNNLRSSSKEVSIDWEDSIARYLGWVPEKPGCRVKHVIHEMSSDTAWISMDETDCRMSLGEFLKHEISHRRCAETGFDEIVVILTFKILWVDGYFETGG